MDQKEKDENRFDGWLVTLAQEVGGIDNLLDTFFGFLQRRTDFFSAEDVNESGVCKELVLKYYEKYKVLAVNQLKEKKQQNRFIDEQRRKRLEEQRKKDEEDFIKMQEPKKYEPKIQEIFEDDIESKNNETNSINKTIRNVGNEDSNFREVNSSKVNANDNCSCDEDDDSDQSLLPQGNGGRTDRYVWTQTLSTVDVIVAVPPGTKSSQCQVEISAMHLKVGIKGNPLIIDGKFHSRVKADDSMWTLVDNKSIQISIEKYDSMKWWNCVIIGDPTIDTKKIVPENSKLSDLDNETRATVEKMMYDQKQKAIGQPTSDQQKQMDILNRFKSAHPELDFSKAKINWGGNPNSFQL